MVQSRGLSGAVGLQVGMSLWLLGSSFNETQAGGFVRKLTLDESAPIVSLFDGIDADQLQVKLAVNGPHEATVSIKNKTDHPLTVALPKAAVAAPVLPQLALPGNQNGGNQINNNPNNAGANNNRPNQAVGGQFQPVGNQQFPNPGGNANQVPGVNMFSIPPEKFVQLNLRTVCLDYGLPDPNVGVNYELQSLEAAITDPVLRQLIEDYSPRVDQELMQAAVWHLASGLSWQQLANLPADNLPGSDTPRFSARRLELAQQQVQQAEKASAEQAKEPAAPVRQTAPPLPIRRTARAPE